MDGKTEVPASHFAVSANGAVLAVAGGKPNAERDVRVMSLQKK